MALYNIEISGRISIARTVQCLETEPQHFKNNLQQAGYQKKQVHNVKCKLFGRSKHGIFCTDIKSRGCKETQKRQESESDQARDRTRVDIRLAFTRRREH